jgi:hypothetical protein
MRGEAAKVGTERWSQNGYLTRKTETGWRFVHHLIAEQKIGRPLTKLDRTYFVDGNRRNLDPSNVAVMPKLSGAGRKGSIVQKIVEVERELEECCALLQALETKYIALLELRDRAER